jgi:hypothetical protein
MTFNEDMPDHDASLILNSPMPLMSVDMWSKIYWPFLEALALSVPQQGDTQGHAATAMKAILSNLPCQVCTWHALAYLEQHPFDASSREAAFKWVVAFHNSLNVRNKKPEFSVGRALAVRLNQAGGGLGVGGVGGTKLKASNQGQDSSSNPWFISGITLFFVGIVLVGVAAALFIRASSIRASSIRANSTRVKQ